MKLLLNLIILCSVLVFSQPRQLRLPAIFSDNMVLQQNATVTIWGWAKPNSKIKITTSWNANQSTTSDVKGYWNTSLQTSKSTKAHSLTISSGAEQITIHNILLGEVWICSGQSNMEMTMADWAAHTTDTVKAKKLISTNEKKIRFFTVPKTISFQPEADCKGKWVECSPAELAKFSAVGFFFGLDLRAQLQVSVGLINASWGGTPDEAWMSGKSAIGFAEYKSEVQLMQENATAFQAQRNWREAHRTVETANRSGEHKWENLSFDDSLCPQLQYSDFSWQVMKLPAYWESDKLISFDGCVWFRRTIRIPHEWIGKKLVLSLGGIDDMDRTFVNGSLVGATESDDSWNKKRIYLIPASLVTSDSVLIAVRVVDLQSGGGIYGPEAMMTLGCEGEAQKLSLTGDWKYLPVAEYQPDRFYVYGQQATEFLARPHTPFELNSATPGGLYNGMISPIAPYTIKGALWYQGEANTGNPELYAKTFPLMISDWRAAFNNSELPFFYVQIAPFDYGSSTASQYLREAQFKTQSVKNTGMVVTLDIGDSSNIHPAQKTEVGSRLALWALNQVYHKPIHYSGPVFQSVKIRNSKVILSFSHTEKGLKMIPVYGQNNFEIAGKDRIFKPAVINIQGSKIIASHPDIKEPVSVRYCWSNTMKATLFNGNQLPASSLRTDNWPR